MSNKKTSIYVLAGIALCLLIAFIMIPLNSSEAAGNKKTAAWTKPDNFDALSTVPAGEPQTQLMEGGRKVQTESRFNVPTFLWASDPGPARSMRQDAVGKKDDAVAAARSHIGSYADRYRLSRKDIAAARVEMVHNTGTGAIIVKFQQDLGGVPVFRDELNVVMNRDLQLISLSGYLTGDHAVDTSSASNFRLQPEDALAAALADLSGRSVDTSALQRTEAPKGDALSKTDDQYTRFTSDRKALPGFFFSEEPSRTKAVMFHMPDGYTPAYYVETAINVPTMNTNVLHASGEAMPEEWAYGYVISAIDGKVLFRMNQVAEQATYRVWADPTTKVPYDTPAGNDVHPKIAATPDGTQYPFLPMQDVTLNNFPFSQNDPWLPGGSTETVGNNSDAFLNIFSPDGYGTLTTTTPTDTPTGDYRAQISSPNAFLHTHTPDSSTSTAEARQGSIQQLFYNINFLHDWFYDAGFDEVSRNAQTNNYGRGGAGNDNIRSQVQDFAGFSNANMQTPADGGRPRMRMYVFPSIGSYSEVIGGAAAGKRGMGISMSGPQAFDVSAPIVLALFSNTPTACTITNAAALDGKIALYDFDNTDATGCTFSTRLARITTTTNAVGIIMAYTSTAPTLIANITGFVPANSKPMGTISWNSAISIKAELAIPNVVNFRMLRQGDRDGSLDNQIVFHEWGHYISNRLIGNASGLVTNHSGGLGEGWGDFTSVLLTVRANDTNTASNATWNGAYAMATYATSGVNALGVGNNGYYYGIRRAPYSTDLNINPLTLKHITNGQTLPVGPPFAFGQDGAQNAEVHNMGEVWANMLWECYAALLRDTQGASPRLTFAQAQTRMKNYLVAGYKATPNAPTILEARDAVIAAAFANDPADGELFGEAFAKRGAGTGAIFPDRLSTTNEGVVESFSSVSAVGYDSSTLDDSIASFDSDGYLDGGESGFLTIKLTNTGLSSLSGATSQVTSNNPAITFPNGNSVTFPNIAPYGTGTAQIRVTAGAMTGIQTPEFSISSSPASPTLNGVPSVVSAFTAYANVDEVASSTSTDSVEGKLPVWTIGTGVAGVQSASAKFRRQTGLPINYKWFVPDINGPSDQTLTSPVMTVDGSASLNLQIDHSFDFEFDSGGNYDGGVIEVSINGGAFADLDAAVYTGTLAAASGGNPIGGRPAFVRNSSGTIHSSLTKAIAPGSTVQVRFRAGSDGLIGAGGWTIDNMAFTGVVETPFSTLVADAPPAAVPVSVGGRVTDTAGRGLSNTVVTITSPQDVTRTTLTNTFGYFRFDGVVAGSTYTVQASAKRYTFAPQVIAVGGNLTNVNFTAQ